ncbi:MAG: site-specific integrase [Betaproteobacteria bacterium]|nr:site-specific integrase [Betaproteobacteria bacterium]
MGSIRVNKGKLFCDFRYKGTRCREYTALADTKQNRQKLSKLLEKIEGEIKDGAFEYARYFPNSRLAKTFTFNIAASSESNLHLVTANKQLAHIQQQVDGAPFFSDFTEKWFDECKIGWRKSYVQTMRDTIDKHLVPYFGEKVVSSIRREDILDFRSQLAKVPGRKNQTLSARRINAIVLGLRQILNEAADRYNFTSPGQRIKPLKIKRLDIKPFTLDEVSLILKTVRQDYRDYFIVRFFTGMRTGEIHGLKWKYVDFKNRLILIRETLVGEEMEDEGKTDLSIREIFMSDAVHNALMRQSEATQKHSEFVFCNTEGKHLNLNNLTNRVWYPLLRYLGLELRRPYTSRHTAATLWLAAGENPEWIARQMGHSTTEMLFRVYSRYVPNLTRNDGSAFNRLLTSNLEVPSTTTVVKNT